MTADPDRHGGADTAALATCLLDMVNSSWMTQAIRVAAELRIPDLLAGGPKRSEELAAAAGAHAPSLDRLLRALTTIEICREGDDGTFELSPMGELLRSEVDGSLRSWTIFWGNHLWPVWGRLPDAVRTGQSGRTTETGGVDFDRLERNPEEAAVFNAAMVELTRLSARSVVEAYDFSGLTRIVDVGGGYGELLAVILVAHRRAQGVLFDLSHAIEAAAPHLQRAGIADRCELVAGNFFDSVPSGADTYVLKSVIHDWNDERSRVILDNCRRAMGSGARLLLVERIVPERLEPSPTHQAIVRSDLTMLVALGAKERTEAEFDALLNSAGFQITRVVPAAAGFSVIEAIPTRS